MDCAVLEADAAVDGGGLGRLVLLLDFIDCSVNGHAHTLEEVEWIVV